MGCAIYAIYWMCFLLPFGGIRWIILSLVRLRPSTLF